MQPLRYLIRAWFPRLAARARERPIFIFGSAYRCGSTLLQRYLNSSGCVFIWGENDGLVERIIEAVTLPEEWTEISDRQEQAFKSKGDSAWIANLNPQVTKSDFLRAALLAYYEEAPPNSAPRWGFKEVKHTSDVADLLLRAFPHGRVLFLVRRFEEVLASNAGTDWYVSVGGAESVKQLWLKTVRSFLSFEDPRSMLIRFETLASRNETCLRQMAHFLDIPRGRFDDRVLETVVRGSSGSPKLAASERRALADPQLAQVSAMLPSC
jgi:hypothetical protein